MNIFAVDKDPVKAAQALCDRHVNKMILETAQILSFVADRYGYPAIYKTNGSHKKHPAAIWAGNRYANWEWTIQHGLALEAEKIYRTGKGHASAAIINFYYQNNYGPPKDDLEKEFFVLCMPEKYQSPKRVTAYRNYYLNEKQFFKDGRRPTWTKRLPPAWWKYK